MTNPPLTERLRRRLRSSVIAPLDARIGGGVRRRIHARRTYRPIFVTGAMGSGTTFVALSLTQRYEVASVITESAHQVEASSFLHNPGIGAFATIEEYADSILPRADWSIERAREDLLRLYRSYTRGPGDAAIDKGPNTSLVRASFLARCFPQAHFVAVFRDPVAIVEGFRRKWPVFGAEPLDRSIDFYNRVYERFLDEMDELGERAILVEYERFVEAYAEMLGALAARLGLRPAARRWRLPERGNYAGQGIRNVRRSVIGVVADANARAYDNLDPEAIAHIRGRTAATHERMRARATP